MDEAVESAGLLPDIWTLIEESEWSQRCSLCRVEMEQGGPIYHNPRKARGARVRCVDCHRGIPEWQKITAAGSLPILAPVEEPTLSVSLRRTLFAFDTGEETPDAVVSDAPQHETAIRTVWAALERDVLIEAAKARRNKA
jgi:hypothetical protein